jgi:hypothetical protein
MSATGQAVQASQSVSKGALWTGRVLSAIPVFMMAMSAVMKLVGSRQVIEGMTRFGYPQNLIVPIGILEISCVIVYLIPQTAVIGAVLVAGYLGGATATMARLGDPGFFMPALLGMMAWLGLWLREPRLHALTPIRK